MQVTVEVTQEDIDRGSPRDGEHCAVAIALKRCAGGFWNVDLWRLRRWQTRIKDRHWSECRVDSPPEVGSFIRAFDYAWSQPQCKPFSFTLELPDA